MCVCMRRRYYLQYRPGCVHYSILSLLWCMKQTNNICGEVIISSFFCRWGRREAELCVLERQNYSWFRFILYLHIWHIFWHWSVQKYMEYIISHYVWHKWCIVQDAKICSLQSPGSAPGMSRQRWQFICLIWESDRWSHNITFFVSCVLHPASLTLYMLLSLI